MSSICIYIVENKEKKLYGNHTHTHKYINNSWAALQCMDNAGHWTFSLTCVAVF